MNTNVVLYLDTRTQKADGTYPLILRILHHRSSTQIPLGIFIGDDHWDKKLRKVKPSYKGTESVTRLNNRLEKKKSDAMDVILKLEERKILDSLSIWQVKDAIVGKSERKSFIQFGYDMAEEFTNAQRIGNARSFKSSLGALKKYCDNRDLSFHELNYEFLKEFENHHYAKGNGTNGLSTYMRTYRAIFNEAIKRNLVEKELYPFSVYKITSTKTRKRAIRNDAIKRIIDCKLEPYHPFPVHPLFHTRNYFLVSYFARGLPFADLAELKMSDLVDGRIKYDRQKTGKPYDVKIIPQLQAILSYYVVGKEKDDYLFPIVKRIDIEDRYKDVMWARSRYNKKLKKLATLCGIEENLTSYVSRHSFATRAKNLGINTAAIQEMLGHESIKTTEIYLDTLPSDELDDLHERIIE